MQAWGMVNYRKTETVRPEFTAHVGVRRIRSYVDGKPIYWADPSVIRMY
jgi:hypothetical protein